LPFAEGSFDAVLVDAPCSGTGTIRHNPEIRYFLREENFAELSGKQFTILENASKLVKIGGRLVYSTCSLEIDENEEVLQRFMTNEKNFKIIMPKTQKKLITPEGYARTFPHCNHIGGFFMGILQRTG
jgi:16S rRNA (cytosine967-C5)-methyltransferase